jgi:hypothetical protein
MSGSPIWRTSWKQRENTDKFVGSRPHEAKGANASRWGSAERMNGITSDPAGAAINSNSAVSAFFVNVM